MTLLKYDLFSAMIDTLCIRITPGGIFNVLTVGCHLTITNNVQNLRNKRNFQNI